MDSVSDYEFHEIFQRVTEYIDLQGKFTPEQIDKELEKAREKCKRLYRNAENGRERIRFKRAALGYLRLIEHDFASRVEHEARTNPMGIIGMTLTHGTIEARRRMLAQERAQRARLWRKEYH